MTEKNTRVAFFTLGCKLNQFESEVIADSFMAGGAEIVPVSENADIYIINTCTVTSKSEQKARRVIRGISRDNPSSLVIVTGCYAQLEREEISSLAQNLVIVPQEEKHFLLEAASTLSASGIEAADIASSLRVMRENGDRLNKSFYSVKKGYLFHSRAFLKIQDGCDNFCRYCRVPLARGRSRSLEISEVLKKTAEIAEAGYRELVLTGVNISSYRSGNENLVSLVEKILENTGEIRIRLSSLEPESIDREYLRIILNERICAHFHLPVQSGSDAILSSMGRKYLSPKLYEAADILRSGNREPLVSADIITGLPGETDKDFGETLRVVEELNFAYLHVFPYSRRPGTAACKMKNHVPERVSRERAGILREVSEKHFLKYAESWTGREVEAVVEGHRKQGLPGWSALSGNYLKLHVTGIPADTDMTGKLVRCRIESHNREEGNSFSAVYLGSEIDWQKK